jgi:hypothetical protein
MTTLDSEKEEVKKEIDLKHTPINIDNEDSFYLKSGNKIMRFIFTCTVDPNMRDYSKEEAIIKQVERAKASLAKYGLPNFNLPRPV